MSWFVVVFEIKKKQIKSTRCKQKHKSRNGNQSALQRTTAILLWINCKPLRQAKSPEIKCFVRFGLVHQRCAILANNYSFVLLFNSACAITLKTQTKSNLIKL